MDLLAQISGILAFGQPVIEAYLGQHGVAIQVLAILGSIRLFVKPTVVFIKAIVAETPTKKDDEAVAKIEASKVTKVILFLADWLLSLKIQAPVVAQPVAVEAKPPVA